MLFSSSTAQSTTLSYRYSFYARDASTLLALLFVRPWLLLPLGLVGLALGTVWPLREAAPDRDARKAEYLIWLSFAPAYAVSVAIFFAAERYRLPLLVPLCVGAGAALDHIWGFSPFRARAAS